MEIDSRVSRVCNRLRVWQLVCCCMKAAGGGGGVGGGVGGGDTPWRLNQSNH